MERKSIVRENIPCWYELSWQEKEPALILRIHNEFIKNTEVNLKNAPIVKSFKEELKLVDFSGNFNESIGFNNVFERQGKKDGFIEFLVKIPQVKILTDKKCENCNGSGKDESLQGKCLFCKGMGKQYIMDWQPAFAISASFTVFLPLLGHCGKDTSVSFPQLLTVRTITRKSDAGGSLEGKISTPLRKWLSSLAGYNSIPEMIQAMKVAYNKMLGVYDYHQFYFMVSVSENGGFTADCPGNACGIHPSDWHMEEGKGYEFSCHNVDTPMQQITLLAGLTAMHDRARREIKI